jgi:hypothetical protein
MALEKRAGESWHRPRPGASLSFAHLDGDSAVR